MVPILSPARPGCSDDAPDPNEAGAAAVHAPWYHVGMGQEASTETGSDIRPEAYDDYDAFLKQAVREYYSRGWKSHRGNFIALVITSGQMASMAADSVRDGSGLRKAAIGAAGVVALRFGLRYFLSGPLGLLVSAAVVASAVAYLIKNQKSITAKLDPCRALIAESRTKFDEIQGGYRAGRYDAAGRNLMVGGLLKRFLEQVDSL
jgi:hypothetical protein